jgi:hypothetical protein
VSNYAPPPGGSGGGGGGSPLVVYLDQRTGLTGADASATTLFTATVAGHELEAIISIVCTVYTSGTPIYVLKWTEGGVNFQIQGTVDATGPFRDFAEIQPDNGTSVTVQLTGTFVATVDVAGSAKVLV